MPPASAPKYRILTERLRKQVTGGELKPGDRMPSFAEMSDRFGATPTTVSRVYHQLEREGLIIREPGRGTFVALTQQRTHGVIGVLGMSLQDDNVPYFSYQMSGLRQVAAAAGRELLLLGETTPSIGWEKLEGVISDGFSAKMLRRLPPGMPCVSCVYPVEEVASVVANDYLGARSATEHLLQLGHRRIGYLISDTTHPISQRRLAGYKAALWEAGIEPQSSWVRDLDCPSLSGKEAGTLGYDDVGRRRMQEWLGENWSDVGCTALLTQNDDTAIGAIGALREAGLRVPDDVSVIGYDGTKLADYFTPRLTTVEVPLREIGRRGMERLLALIEGRDTSTENEILPVRLKVGRSTAQVKQD
jgi:DNA-binding LacI/PurR family transcriptional regulator